MSLRIDNSQKSSLAEHMRTSACCITVHNLPELGPISLDQLGHVWVKQGTMT